MRIFKIVIGFRQMLCDIASFYEIGHLWTNEQVLCLDIHI